ncbi:MAG: hypothetical protein IKU19_08925, partial [Clostridia bacterium]|nr:hypothetical protein [Clostridia bacterium]
NKLTLDISAKKQRIETLRRMEDLFEGYTGSVRSVMSAAERGNLRGIIGPLSKIIEVESEYAVAIETSLGAQIQNIVCENERDAKEAIRYLKENRKGRATFYPLTSIKPQYLPDNCKLEGMKGYLGLASELVKTEERFYDVIDSLLARTAVFDTLDNANVAAKANDYKLRCVTLDGQLINAGGSFTGGSLRQDSGILTRSAEIESINEEIKKAEADLNKTEKDIEEQEKIISDNQGANDDITARKALFTSLCSAEETQKQVLMTQLTGDKARKAAITASLESIDREQSDTEASIVKANETIKSLEADISALDEKMKKLLSRRDTMTREQSDISVAMNLCGIEIEKKKKDIDQGEYEISIRRDALDELISKRNIEDNKISAAKEKLDKIAEKISGGKEESEKIAQEISKMQTEIASISEQNILNEAKETKLREETKDLTHKRETLFREYTKLETQCESIQSEQDKLISHLWDEYELSFSAACELRYEPVTESTRPEAVRARNELRGKIKHLGHV